MTGSGTFRQFTATQHFGRFRSEADIEIIGAPVRIKLRTRMLLTLRYNFPPLQVRLPVKSASWPAKWRRRARGGVRVRFGWRSGKAQNKWSALPPKDGVIGLLACR